MTINNPSRLIVLDLYISRQFSVMVEGQYFSLFSGCDRSVNHSRLAQFHTINPGDKALVYELFELGTDQSWIEFLTLTPHMITVTPQNLMSMQRMPEILCHVLQTLIKRLSQNSTWADKGFSIVTNSEKLRREMQQQFAATLI